MQTVTVTTRDDTDGTTDDTVATRRFGLDGIDYEIDLSDENYAEMKDRLDLYIDCARVVLKRSRSRSKAARAESTEIRRWAQQQGITVFDNGRLPAKVRQQYLEAHAAA